MNVVPNRSQLQYNVSISKVFLQFSCFWFDIVLIALRSICLSLFPTYYGTPRVDGSNSIHYCYRVTVVYGSDLFTRQFIRWLCFCFSLFGNLQMDAFVITKLQLKKRRILHYSTSKIAGRTYVKPSNQYTLLFITQDIELQHKQKDQDNHKSQWLSFCPTFYEGTIVKILI